MAQSGGFSDDFLMAIECPICSCYFSEPKMLKCLHSVCKSCLQSLLGFLLRSGKALRCPTCYQIIEYTNDINSFPSHLFLKQLVDIFEAYTGQGQDYSQLCEKCNVRKSLELYCSDCSHFMCEDCAWRHKKWKDFSGHRLKEIRNLDSSDALDYARRANTCKKHNDEFRHFCELCNTFVCYDCVIDEHIDHIDRITSLEEGLEVKKSEIEVKIIEVQVNSFRLKDHKESLEKRRLKVNKSFEQATKEVQETAERCINLIRRHEESVTERLMKQKESFEAEFVNQMTSLDGKFTDIGGSLKFGEEVLFRNHLPEILKVQEMLEDRLRELSVHFVPMLNFPEVRYTRNDMSSLIEAPGKLHTTSTEPSLSVGEGEGLTEAVQGEFGTFTVITKDANNQTTYSEIDGVDVAINSLRTRRAVKTHVTDCKNGQYLVKYKSDTGGDFNVSISVRGEAIKGSPFRLTVIEKTTKELAGTQNFVFILFCLDTWVACFRAPGSYCFYSTWKSYDVLTANFSAVYTDPHDSPVIFDHEVAKLNHER